MVRALVPTIIAQFAAVGGERTAHSRLRSALTNRNRTKHDALFAVMALSSPLRQGRVSFVERLGKMLHVQYDEVLNEPLPQRWVDLIKYLNAKEQPQREALQPADAPQVRRPR